MSKKKYPTAFDRALEDDREALQDVLGTIISPTFDLAWHATGEAARARELTATIMHELAQEIPTGNRKFDDPLVWAAWHWWQDLRPAEPGVHPVLDHHGRRADATERRVLLLTLAADLEPAEIAQITGWTTDDASERVEDSLHRLGGDRANWADLLDAHAAAAMLPSGLLDFLDEDAA